MIFCLRENAINKSILSLFDSMKASVVIICFLLLGFSACIKAPTYPVVPAIEFVSVSSATLKSGYADTITFSFTDGDGDIGVNPSAGDTCSQCLFKTGDSTCLKMGSFNVFMLDSRDSCLSYFASANIEPTGKFDDLAGEIDVIRAIDHKKCLIVPDPNCLYRYDTVVYTIILRDKAGNYSNAVQTVPIAVDAY